MKILFINSTDKRTGAGIAAVRLMRALIKNNVQVDMLVNYKSGPESSVFSHNSSIGEFKAKLVPRIDRLPLYKYKDRQEGNWSSSWISSRVIKKVDLSDYDAIHLHWICNGTLSIKELGEINKPIIWTLHDMWPFTGGCHYDNNCKKYRDDCGGCPYLGSSDTHDLSYQNLMKKKKSWRNLKLQLITPSTWLEGCVRESSLFHNNDVQTIHNCLDTKIFNPINKKEARVALSLPPNKRIILFGAANSMSDKRKGWTYLESLLKRIDSNFNLDEIAVAVFGTPNGRQKKKIFGIECIEMGTITNDSDASLLYSASDVFVCPSVQDNFPNTIIESLACGTPVLGFKVGGLPDAVLHKETGYLAEPFDTEELFDGLKWIFSQLNMGSDLQGNCRNYIEENTTEEIIAAKYREIYTNFTTSKSR